MDRVLLAAPRGFCAGVEMAIKALAWMVRVFEPPVYCYHEIVHNQVVVDRFRQLGVIFVDDVGEVPDGAPLMLSAHGSAPEVVAAARANRGPVVNAVCPLVTKVHREVKLRAGKGYTVMYVGHEGHDEAVGTMAVAPDAVRLVENEADVAAMARAAGPGGVSGPDHPGRSTSGGACCKAAQERFPDLWVPGRSDLCFATTNRQAALKAIAGKADAVVVIGSANSSNTLALERTARAAGAARVLRVDGADALPDDLTGVVGVTAGASAPEELVRAVLERLAPADGVEEVTVTDEDEYFPLPPELRDLLRATAAAAAVRPARPARRGSRTGPRRTARRPPPGRQRRPRHAAHPRRRRLIGRPETRRRKLDSRKSTSADSDCEASFRRRVRRRPTSAAWAACGPRPRPSTPAARTPTAGSARGPGAGCPARPAPGPGARWAAR